MMKGKSKTTLLAFTLSVAMLAGNTLPVMAAPQGSASDSYESQLTQAYTDPDRSYQSDIRWWLPEASLTDKQIKEEIQEMYDKGFHGVELCMQTDSKADPNVYAYGSKMWAHKWKLMMKTLLEHGMEVSLTSGTNWSTSNVPGLDPDSQEASQVIAEGQAVVAPGETLKALPKPDTMRESNKGKFLGAYAYKIKSSGSKVIKGSWGSPDRTISTYVVDENSMIDLNSETFTEGATIYDQACNWTAPAAADGENISDDSAVGKYIVYAYWTHGNYVTASPAAETCYATNYFDERGVEALKKFWTDHYLNDPELNNLFKSGDVQLFMDSLEINPTGGITWWTEDIRDEFKKRKGYDILPYIFLVKGLPQVQAVYTPYTPPAQGDDDLSEDSELREKIINDWVDVLTQLYDENMLKPLQEWLHTYNIKTRAQISYGRSFEITEPSVYVDYSEAENLNQYDNIDVFRLHTAGSKLMNTVLSTETGANNSTQYAASVQRRLHSLYSEYAAGFQRVIWHVWSATASYGTESTWPGAMPGFPLFDRWDNREPDYDDMDEFNAHIGRIQKLMQTGKARTDIGFIHNNWNQGMLEAGEVDDGSLTSMQFEYAHMGVYYRSTELQDNGYTYDYLSPDLLNAPDVTFDATTKTIEPAGYKALVIYQRWMDPDGAKKILGWAEQGLPVVVMQGAAKETPFNDNRDQELAETMAKLEDLPNVRVAKINDADENFDYFNKVDQGYDDDCFEAMQELGVEPYSGYIEPNKQLLGQTRIDDQGNEYLYLYNYCPNDYHKKSHIASVQNLDHGTNIKTDMVINGTYVPYEIDAWTGKAEKVEDYHYDSNGNTVFGVDLDYDNVALYALEKTSQKDVHVTETNADKALNEDGKISIITTKSGKYETTFSDGSKTQSSVAVPESYPVKNWNVTIQSWTDGGNGESDEETIDGVHTINTLPKTNITDYNINMDILKTWDQIDDLGDGTPGKNVSGVGTYEATFNWDSSKADGAYLNLGDKLSGTMKIWINGVKVGGEVSSNPTKAKASIADGSQGVDQYTGGISYTKPIADISQYLKNGQNAIKIVYNSNLCNAALSADLIREGTGFNPWWGFDTKVLSYGPSQAVIQPYVKTLLKDTNGKQDGNGSVGIPDNNTSNNEPVNNKFVDVQNKGTYYYEPVYWAVKNGITVGTTDTTFSPDQGCTRGQIVSFLYRQAGSPSVEGLANPFKDVTDDAYYHDAVIWAAHEGITVGTTATTFSPDAKCTRGQIVTFLYRSEDDAKANGTEPFTDVNEKDYYYDSVRWATETGVTKGTTATTFSPNATCTRGQAVTFLYRTAQ